MPENIKNKLDELDRLVEDYPEMIPVSKAADFLGMTVHAFYDGMALNAFPFAVSYQKQRRVFFVFTAPFYLWYTNTRGMDRKEAARC